MPYLRRNIGLVFQDQKLLYDRSVYDNVMLPLAFSGASRRSEAARRARAALDKVGLLGAREGQSRSSSPAASSSASRIARAVVNRPAMLVADEPTANLDAESAARILEIFVAFNQVGVTVLIATHDQALVERYGKRVLRLRGRTHRMSAWLRQHRQACACAAALQQASSLLNALVIGIALALPAGGYALLESLRAGRRAPRARAAASRCSSRRRRKRADAEALGARLRADRRIASVRFVPREQALKEMSAVQGLAEVIAALGRNPLPDAFVRHARSAATSRGELAQAAGRGARAGRRGLGAAAGGAAAASRSSRSALLAALLGAALVAVTFNTIRLQILTQRDEIEVSKLIGATDAFIRRPFYYLGLLQGLAGGVLALAIVAAALALLNREVRVLAESYGSNFRFAFLPLADALAVVLLAGAAGLAGRPAFGQPAPAGNRAEVSASYHRNIMMLQVKFWEPATPLAL